MTCDRQLTLSVLYVRYAKTKATNPISELPLTCFLWSSREFIDDDDFVINVFRRQGCPHLGQGHGPIVSSRHRI